MIIRLLLTLLLAVSGAALATEFSQAVAALDGGRLDEATLLFGKIVADHPDHPEANYYLGVTHLRAGRYGEARRHLARAARIAPENGAAFLALGLAEAGSGDSASASASLAEACRLNPGDAQSCYFQGRTLYLLGRFAEAEAPLAAAIIHSTPDDRAKVHRAAALNFIGLNRPVEAEERFRDAVLHFRAGAGREDDPRVDYGSFLLRAGRANEAIPLLKQAVEAGTASPRASAELGKALLDTGSPEAAAAHLERAVSREPSAWAYRLLLGRALLQLGRVEEAERHLSLGRKSWSESNSKQK